MTLERKTILPETQLPDADETIQAGRALARDWNVGSCSFLTEFDVRCEAEFKRAQMARGEIMQHAQVGFRDPEKSRRAWAEIYEKCDKEGVGVDRYGICLDWSMGYPRDSRTDKMRGTGLILEDIEEFVTLTQEAPVAPHFGDFVLGFPGSIETAQAALAAGSTSIGNLGQYFTFRLPGWDDDVATTRATLTALALLAAQPVEVLVHSNLDDGYAAQFTDLASSLGAVLLEKHIVEKLIGGSISHCYGHHFSDPLRRMAFQLALAQATDTPGTMIYGNTTSYIGGDAQNYASLSSYLLSDIHTQIQEPTGHAVNPVPVRENSRIPDIDEIVNAQLFAARLTEHAARYGALIDMSAPRELASEIVSGGRAFFSATLDGLAQAGIDTNDPFEMLLALRRIGGRRLEREFGAGRISSDASGVREPVVASPVLEEIEDVARARLEHLAPRERAAAVAAGFSVLVATTDVHEHGKMVVERILGEAGITARDGGVSVDPDALVNLAGTSGVDAIAISTYNGVALAFVEDVFVEMAQRKLDIPVMVGGRLNQIPAGSNTSLPVDVTRELREAGAIVCVHAEELVPALLKAAAEKKGPDTS